MIDLLFWQNGKKKSPPVAAQQLSQAESAGYLLELQPKVTWVLDEVNLDENRLFIRGWAILKETSATDRLVFTVNGQPMTRSEFGLSRPDLSHLFWFIPHAEQSGFVSEIDLTDLKSADFNFLSFQLCESDTLNPLNPNNESFWIRPGIESLPFPEPERRNRVHGSTEIGRAHV